MTAFKDAETFEPVYSLKKIAINYISNGSFFVHILAAFPYELVTNPSCISDGTPEDTLRNLLILKMLRLSRLSTDFIPDDVLLSLMQYFYKPETRDDKISNDRTIINVIKIIK